MATVLPRLRMDLDFMPSPVEDTPGLLIRDSFQYSDAVLVVPPALVQCLPLFDGQHTELDLKAALVRITGELDVSSVQEQLAAALSGAGFLHDRIYEELRQERHRSFAASSSRESAHAGSAYPENESEVRPMLAQYLSGITPSVDGSLIGIAAPHVSPFGGWQSYAAAYGALHQGYRDRIFVILGTSHYGEPGRFGLTRKDFVTPYGVARTEQTLVDELGNEPAALMEDYCHAVEHSIEFQVLFLQHVLGAGIRILPILCGSFYGSLPGSSLPEHDDRVKSFIDRLGEIAAREGKKLLWILGIDMAHMGARYHDSFIARANEGVMNEIAERDNARIERVSAGDPEGFWDLVRQNNDDLKWCGSSPLYTFLRAVPSARGELRRYEQWNIDERSVVSFAGMTFS